jgi:hypothetical protein
MCVVCCFYFFSVLPGSEQNDVACLVSKRVTQLVGGENQSTAVVEVCFLAPCRRFLENYFFFFENFSCAGRAKREFCRLPVHLEKQTVLIGFLSPTAWRAGACMTIYKYNILAYTDCIGFRS